MFESVTDSEIEAAINQYDDIDHEDAYDVGDVREMLTDINADALDHWELYEDAIDEGAHEIVYEDDGVLVLADHTGHLWDEQFEAVGISDQVREPQAVIRSLHHTAARQYCDYSWSTSAPIVIEKSSGVQAGEGHTLHEIARRTDELGSVARAVDSLATETHGWSKSNWARLTGRNPSTVTRTTDN